MEYKITVTEQEANIILAALGELPAKTSIDLILKVKQEFMAQMQQAPEIEAEAEVVSEDES